MFGHQYFFYRWDRWGGWCIPQNTSCSTYARTRSLWEQWPAQDKWGIHSSSHPSNLKGSLQKGFLCYFTSTSSLFLRVRVFFYEASFDHLSHLVLKEEIGNVFLPFWWPFRLSAAFLRFCFFGSCLHVC